VPLIHIDIGLALHISSTDFRNALLAALSREYDSSDTPRESSLCGRTKDLAESVLSRTNAGGDNAFPPGRHSNSQLSQYESRLSIKLPVPKDSFTNCIRLVSSGSEDPDGFLATSITSSVCLNYYLGQRPRKIGSLCPVSRRRPDFVSPGLSSPPAFSLMPGAKTTTLCPDEIMVSPSSDPWPPRTLLSLVWLIIQCLGTRLIDRPHNDDHSPLPNPSIPMFKKTRTRLHQRPDHTHDSLLS